MSSKMALKSDTDKWGKIAVCVTNKKTWNLFISCEGGRYLKYICVYIYMTKKHSHGWTHLITPPPFFFN